MSISHRVTDAESLAFHSSWRRGKIETGLSKPLNTIKDLSMAYSPGVGAVCKAIAGDGNLIYEYTNKGNFVAVVTNGTAVLGYGDLGCAAAKPVMEGKSALFKRFADVDSVDIEVSNVDCKEFIATVRSIGETWGGINLEDIKAPECFIIEKELRSLLTIPVFHDDQHGTAIIILAGMINAAYITGRSFADMKVVVNGAGAAGIACLDLLKHYGLKNENAIICDTRGVIYDGRTSGMNQWKAKHAIKTSARTLADAFVDADVFLGLSVKGAVNQAMIKTMRDNPIVFAMANPDPEITPEEVISVCPDAIVATGRSDYPNQINNIMGFPYIFRGALDVRASQITEEMKIAAALAISDLAREHVPEEIKNMYSGKILEFGKDYIIPKPFDKRLIVNVSMAVAKAAVSSGVARINIDDWKIYARELKSRVNKLGNIIDKISDRLVENAATLVFAEGEELNSIVAANMWCNNNGCKAILIGLEHKIGEISYANKLTLHKNVVVTNVDKKLQMMPEYAKLLYSKHGNHGMSLKNCELLIRTDCNVLAALMLKYEEADCLISGITSSYNNVMLSINQVFNTAHHEAIVSISVVSIKERTIFVANVILPYTDSKSDNDANLYIAATIDVVQFVRKLTLEPSVAFVSASNISEELLNNSCQMAAINIMNDMNTDFKYDKNIIAFSTISSKLSEMDYISSSLKCDANIFMMPNSESACIAIDSMKAFGNAAVIGPILLGLEKCAQIVNGNATATEIFNIATISCCTNK